MSRKHLFFLLIAAGPVFAGHDWDHYAVIMERSPFGKDPLTEESAEQAKPVGEFAKQYRLCMLYEDTQGKLKAGIVNKVNNKNFFLQVGESSKEFSLVEVHIEEGIAVLQQGDEIAQLVLEGLGAPILSTPQAIAVSSSTPASAPQQIRRNGMQSVPGHILAALTDSAPKQAQITVRKTQPIEHSEKSSDQSSMVDPQESVIPKEDSALFSAGDTKTVAAQPRAPANYLVQSVPKRWNPF